MSKQNLTVSLCTGPSVAELLPKQIDTLRARCALAGIALHVTDHDRGRPPPESDLKALYGAD